MSILTARCHVQHHDQHGIDEKKLQCPASMHVLSNLQCSLHISDNRAKACRAVTVSHNKTSYKAASSAQSSRTASQTCRFCSRPFVRQSQRKARQVISVAEGVSFYFSLSIWCAMQASKALLSPATGFCREQWSLQVRSASHFLPS